MAFMPLISGTCFLIASSTPAFNVIGDIGHLSHDPNNSKFTIFLLSIDNTLMSPPSAIKYGLISSIADSTLFIRLYSFIM